MQRLMLAVILFLGPSWVHAETFKILGPRPMGMGGAFVAMAEGGLAQYWNPAGLALDATNSKWGVQIPVGGKVEFTGGVLNDANTLGNLASQFSSIQSAQKNGTPGAMDANKMSVFLQALPAISDMNQPGKGALGDIEGGTNLKLGKFAVSVNNFTSVGAAPFVDIKNIGLGSASGISGVKYTGANTTLCGGGSCLSAPSNATQAAAASSIQSSLASSYSSLDTLTGGQLSANGVTASNLGNALVNMAASNGATTAQIQQAATQISQNAAAAAPLIQAAASGNPYTNNQSNLTVRGASLTEVAFGYGRQLFIPGLYLGGNLKMIFARVGYTRYNVMQNSSGSTNVLQQFKDNTASSAAPALDLGALWKANQVLPALPFDPRVGIVAKNINNPQFNQPSQATADGDSSKYPVNGQLRMGLAISPLRFWNIAADMDLTENLTPLPGYRSRMFGLGTEVNVFNRAWINIPLRAGLMKNTADPNSKLAYTAGFGLNFLHFMLDVGGAISSDQTQIKDGQKLPSNAGVAAQLAFMF